MLCCFSGKQKYLSQAATESEDDSKAFGAGHSGTTQPTLLVSPAPPKEYTAPGPTQATEPAARVRATSAPAHSTDGSIVEPKHLAESAMNYISAEEGSAQGHHAQDDTGRHVLLADFHEQQHLAHVVTERELLADLKLVGVLGKGGYAVCWRGYWRGASCVAVKVMLTKDQQVSSRGPSGSETAGGYGMPSDASTLTQQGQAGGGSAGGGAHNNNNNNNSNATGGPTTAAREAARRQQPVGFPSAAVVEALLSRDLAHPNIVRTFDVRCCRLSSGFVKAVQTAPPSSNMAAALVSGFNMDNPSLGGVDAEAINVWQSWTGSTPLNQQEAAAPMEESVDFMSGDGFGGAHSRDALNAGVTWHSVMDTLGAKPGDYLTVIVQQFCDCGTLESAIVKGFFMGSANDNQQLQRRRLRALLRTAEEVAAALDHLHSRGVIHGDLKPANILLQGSRTDARGFTAQVADFGLSQICSQAGVVQGSVQGTVQFMAPELLQHGESSYKTDIYAFGILLWTMVTAKRPYRGLPTGEMLYAVQFDRMRPAWPQGFMPQLEELYYRCVAVAPADRPTASWLVNALQRLQQDVRRSARSPSTGETVPTPAPAAHQPQPLAKHAAAAGVAGAQAVAAAAYGAHGIPAAAGGHAAAGQQPGSMWPPGAR